MCSSLVPASLYLGEDLESLLGALPGALVITLRQPNLRAIHGGDAAQMTITSRLGERL
jgi:hypothetical protein